MFLSTCEFSPNAISTDRAEEGQSFGRWSVEDSASSRQQSEPIEQFEDGKTRLMN
jgi:hypothetical protein